MRFYLSSLLLIIHAFAFAQISIVDSLNAVLKTSKEDTTKVNLMNDISDELRLSGEYAKADSTVNKAFSLSEKIKYDKGSADALGLLGSIKMNLGDYKGALQAHSGALKIHEKTKNKTGIANSKANMGAVHYMQSDYGNAMENYTAALHLFEELRDKKGIARCLGNIGLTYEDQGQYLRALDYYFDVLKLKEEEKDKSGIAKYCGTIGNIFYYQSDYSKALEYYNKALKIKRELYSETGKKKDNADICLHLGNIGNVYYSKKNYAAALEYYFKALKIAEALESKQLMANNLGNIGNVYLAEEKYPEALEYYFKTLGLASELDNKILVTNNMSNIGSLYLLQNDYGKAEDYLQKALSLAVETGNYDAEKEIHQSLSDLYRKQNRWQQAFEHFRLYVTAKDSIFNDENTRKTVRSELNFEFEKKQAIEKVWQEKKDAIEAKEKQQQRIILYSISAVLLLVSLLVIFISRGYRQKQKANVVITQQKEEVEKAKRIIEDQKELVEEKQKEVMDSINYAKRIQYALLAHEELLKPNLPEHFVFFQPKDVVSGDFYWATKITSPAGTERFYLAVCDSTGHGVPGAFMSLLNTSYLSEAISEKNIETPDKIFNYVREKLIRSVSIEGGQDGMDGILICFERSPASDRLKITYAAAHNSPLWVSNGTILDLKADKMPVGKGERDASFTLFEIAAQPGDVLFLYTDGFADQFGGPKGKKFKYRQLNELLVEISGKPMQEQKNKLADTLNTWKGNLEQVDDILIVGIVI